MALLKELAENPKEATTVRSRTETYQQRQAQTHPDLLANGLGSKQANSQTILHRKWQA